MKYLTSSDIKIIKKLATIKITQRTFYGGMSGNNATLYASKNPDSEFQEHRIYNHGEGSRFVDWKVYARKEKLFVKDFLQERKKICEIFIDISASIGCNDEYKITFLRSILYLCGILLCRGEILNITLLNWKNHWRIKAESFNAIIELDNLFSKIKFDRKNVLPEVFAERLNDKDKSSLFFFCSDFFWEKNDLSLILRFLDKMPSKKFFLHIIFPYINEIFNICAEVKLVDSETSENINLNIGELRKIIRIKYDRWLNEIASLVKNSSVKYVKIKEIPDDMIDVLNLL